ncbi:hypothetical protein [Pontibacter chitinilyticus]|uniref:hypothetical protein n=1 Tax=Pontibacter chitinilyticus TaxID=2674989 RepID=UPI00321BDEF8
MRHIACVTAILLAFSLAACNHTSKPAQQPEQATLPDSTITSATHNRCQITAPVFVPATDEIKDASLQHFLQQLQQAVQQRDAQQLTSLLDPNIATGFDGSGGSSSFKKRWQLEDQTAAIWPLLHQLLQLGGTYMRQDSTNSTFALPYVYSAWPDSLDAFAYQAVVRDGAILRAEPDSSAPAICTLGRVILQTDYNKSYPLQENGREKTWWYVSSPDGQLHGYLYKSDLYSPVGYRALFNKNKQGQWRMTALVSGD